MDNGARPKQMFNKHREGRVYCNPSTDEFLEPRRILPQALDKEHMACADLGFQTGNVFTASGKVDHQDTLGLNLNLSGPSRVQAPVPESGRQDLSREALRSQHTGSTRPC